MVKQNEALVTNYKVTLMSLQCFSSVVDIGGVFNNDSPESNCQVIVHLFITPLLLTDYASLCNIR